MNLLKLLVCFAIVLASCSTSKKTTSSPATDSQTTTSATTNSSQDGSSYENAIIINEKTEGPGVDAEYKWLKKNYPGYKMISQSLDHKGSKHYDLLHIQTADGEKKTIYFDITNFFGKW